MDYLQRRFPLDRTSTVYMDGTEVYSLVRHDKPGIIASVALLPADAETFRQAVRAAQADAWEEGAMQALREEGYDVAAQASVLRKNPYREEVTDE